MTKAIPKTHKIINLDGKPELVLVPYADYIKLLEASGEDNPKPKAASKKSVQPAAKPSIPDEVVWRIQKGDSPVKAWRKYRDLTQAQLAAMAGVGTSAVTLIETGARHGKPETLEAIARVLDVSVKVLTKR